MSLASLMVCQPHVGQLIDGWVAYCDGTARNDNPHTNDPGKERAWWTGFDGAQDADQNDPTMTNELMDAYAGLSVRG